MPGLLEALQFVIADHGVDHVSVGFVVAQVTFESYGVVTSESFADPFHLPWFEGFGAFELSFVM